eukprot:4537513-Heterocapsa_arctica.AAC.1
MQHNKGRLQEVAEHEGLSLELQLQRVALVHLSAVQRVGPAHCDRRANVVVLQEARVKGDGDLVLAFVRARQHHIVGGPLHLHADLDG